MREDERNNRNLAVGGIIGGVLMMLANIIIHMGTTGKTPDPGWIDMPGMLPGITEILAVLAAAGLLAGWVSLYRMVRESCGSKMQKLAIAPTVGVVGMSLFHGNINCIEPLVYKTLALSGSESMFPAMDAAISGSFAPVDLLILAAFYLQLIILIYGVFSGKLGVKKWLILLNPVCGLIVGIVLGAVLPGSLSGIPMGMRNLGEGLMYLIPYAYWQNHRA